jgi:hypothetical protein
MLIFLILLRKIKKMSIHSLFYFAAEGGESLLIQVLPFPRSGGTSEADSRGF